MHTSTTNRSEPEAPGGFYNLAGHVQRDECWSAPPQVPAKHAQRFAWRLRRALRGVIDDGLCTCIPAYTGGRGRPVSVDGELRTPACFGSRGEPWAHPLGCGRMCVPDFAAEITVIDPTPRRNHSILVELYA